MGIGDVGYTRDIFNPGAGNVKFVPNPPQTPNLDAMAASPHSIVFHRFYAGSAVCSPSRSAALTGRAP
jgi:arylsulfatase A-like enzyme